MSNRLFNKCIYVISKVLNYLYEKNIRRKLSNADFSIICSNCIGGIIYHRLGLEFLSPTINLWMSQPDFLKFVLNMKEYLKLDLRFIEEKYEYPVAELGDIRIHFNHYHSNSEAEDCWNRRKKRINFENLFIIMYDRDGITKKDMMQLEKVRCKNKVILSVKDYSDLDYVLKLQPSKNPNGEQCMDANIWGIRTFEKQFDFVTWLNEV